MKEIEGYEGRYSVTKDGNIYSHRNGRFLKPILHRQGYLRCKLYKGDDDYKGIVFYNHRLVALAYIKNLENKKTVNHIDGNKMNNNISNLEWMTQCENMQHSFDIGLRSHKGENHPSSKLNEAKVRIIKTLFNRNDITQQEISNFFDVSFSAISDIKTGRSWKHLNVSTN